MDNHGLQLLGELQISISKGILGSKKPGKAIAMDKAKKG
jgi:hypothetical protein